MVRLSGINEICKKPNYDGQRLESVCLHIYVQVHAPPPLLGSTKTKTISSCHAKTNITPSQMICEAKSIIMTSCVVHIKSAHIFPTVDMIFHQCTNAQF